MSYLDSVDSIEDEWTLDPEYIAELCDYLEKDNHEIRFFDPSDKPFSNSEDENDADQLNLISGSEILINELCTERNRWRIWRKHNLEKGDLSLEFLVYCDGEYCRIFLESGSSNIYDIDQGKIEKLKSGIALSFLLDGNRICLACNQQMPNNLQLLYEHLFHVDHLNKLDQLIMEDHDFDEFEDQFSNLFLAKEFMAEVTDDVTFCFACMIDIDINTGNNVIRNHIETDDHKVKSEEQKELNQEICNTFVEQLSNAWYIVQRFWCQLCNQRFEHDIHFAKHLNMHQHFQMVKKIQREGNEILKDVCITCGSMSMGKPDTYTKHCDDKMHKYLLRSKDYVVPEMKEPAKNLLKNVEEIAESLVLESDAATFSEEKFGLVLRHLEEAVKLDYPEAKAYAFGSRVSNLAFSNSNFDIFLDCGEAYNGTQRLSTTREYLLNSQICLESQPDKWEVRAVFLKTRTPFIRVYHRELRLNCNVSFINGLTVEKTKIVRLFMVLYPPCRKMVLYLKKWLNSCSLFNFQSLTTYGITWFVIYYLQQIKVFPSIAELMRNKSQSKIISDWETGIDENIPIKDCSLELKELLKGFFEFYANYNYRYCVISPLMGESLNKRDFTYDYICSLPQELGTYIQYFVNTPAIDSPEREIFRIDSPLCLQDPIDLAENITMSASKMTLRTFKEYCRTSAKILSHIENSIIISDILNHTVSDIENDIVKDVRNDIENDIDIGVDIGNDIGDDIGNDNGNDIGNDTVKDIGFWNKMRNRFRFFSRRKERNVKSDASK